MSTILAFGGKWGRGAGGKTGKINKIYLFSPAEDEVSNGTRAKQPDPELHPRDEWKRGHTLLHAVSQHDGGI